ncbi:TPA: transposase [Legionella bozemanae]|nr:transposase [Legionella bozemanae]
MAIKITTGAIHDSVPSLEQLNYVKQNALSSLNETIADRAYGSGEIISFLRAQALTTYTPLLSSRSGSSENSIIDGFQYDSIQNQYVCPQNAILKPCKSQGDTTIYISSTKDCKQCSFSPDYLAKIKNKGPARYVTRNKYAELYNQMKNEMEQQYFKEKLYERMWKLEGIMNELKNYHDLKRAQYRGLENTQIQAYFAAMAAEFSSAYHSSSFEVIGSANPGFPLKENLGISLSCCILFLVTSLFLFFIFLDKKIKDRAIAIKVFK